MSIGYYLLLGPLHECLLVLATVFLVYFDFLNCQYPMYFIHLSFKTLKYAVGVGCEYNGVGFSPNCLVMGVLMNRNRSMVAWQRGGGHGHSPERFEGALEKKKVRQSKQR